MSAGEIAVVMLWAGIAAADETAAFQSMLHQPLVSCTVIGALLGDPSAGLWVGVALQAVWSGLLPLGATSYPDVPVGSVVGAAASVLALRAGAAPGAGAALGVAAGLVVGVLGSGTVRALRRAGARLGPAADAAADRGDTARIVLINLAGAAASFVRGAVLAGAGLAAVAGVAPAMVGQAGAALGRAPVEPVLGVGLGVLAATFAAGGRRRYAVFVLSAAAAFLLDWKVL